eukprot:TRINITY_DN2851_c0_g1_i1.p1 TRINITY_DN2851_c0_g1~~TRINITY_DN2851_c0_g1_i1.p1  ORF type:complete len:484 (+),score=139.94 TRINITY_DN2851_c0_g1_i1:67-1518(+)
MSLKVNYNLERMVPELTEYRDFEIFTEEEIREIVDRRRGFELKINSRGAKKTDFLEYIKYDLTLDLLRSERKKLLELKPLKSDHSIKRAIMAHYLMALRKFPTDMELWNLFIRHQLQIGARKALSKTLGKALSLFPKQAHFWITTAQIEFSGNRNIESGRALLQEGLKHNINKANMWNALIDLESAYLGYLFKSNQLEIYETDTSEVIDAKKQLLDGETIVLVVKDAIEQCNTSCLIDICDHLQDVRYLSENNLQKLLSAVQTKHSDDLDIKRFFSLEKDIEDYDAFELEMIIEDIDKSVAEKEEALYILIEREETIKDSWFVALEKCENIELFKLVLHKSLKTFGFDKTFETFQKFLVVSLHRPVDEICLLLIHMSVLHGKVGSFQYLKDLVSKCGYLEKSCLYLLNFLIDKVQNGKIEISEEIHFFNRCKKSFGNISAELWFLQIKFYQNTPEYFSKTDTLLHEMRVVLDDTEKFYSLLNA